MDSLPVLEHWALRFADPVLEKAFERLFTEEKARGDYSRLSINLLGTLCYQAAVLLSHRRLDAVVWSSMTFSALVFLHLCIVRWLPFTTYAQFRTRMVFGLRLALDLMSAWYLGAWADALSGSHVDSLRTAFKYLIVSPGVTMQPYISLSMPLLWRHSALMHFGTGLLYSMRLNPQACKVLLASSYGTQLVARAWKAVEAVWLCSTNSLWFHAGMLPSLADLQMPGWDCLSLVTLLQVGLGFALPNVVLYMHEHASRVHFYKQRRTVRTQLEEADLALGIGSWLELPFALAWALLGVMALCVLWEMSMLVQILMPLSKWGVPGLSDV